MKSAFPWDTEREWRLAGGRLHKLQGLVVPEVVRGSHAFVASVWHDSYEAEQHLVHVGRADEPVCWNQCGFASRYLSYANGREIYCIEIRCRGRGDAVCHMIGKPREEWGDLLGEHLPFYAKAGLDEARARAAEEVRKTERRLRSHKQRLASYRVDDDTGVTARSPAMRKVLQLASRIARVDSTALITGESGVGKERLARLIHDLSGRAQRPMVAINCGALPEQLLESELFGHVRGAFTGATQDRPGAVRGSERRHVVPRRDRRGAPRHAGQAPARTAGARDPPRRREPEPQGRSARDRGDQSRADRGCRGGPIPRGPVLSASRHRAERSGAARASRRHRASRAHPPRRRRAPDAVEGDVVHAARGRAAPPLPVARQRAELENALERAAVLATSTRVDVDDLPVEVAQTIAPPWRPDNRRSLADVEKDCILAELAAHGGNRTKAAAHLRIAPATLYRKLAQYRGRKNSKATGS